MKKYLVGMVTALLGLLLTGCSRGIELESHKGKMQLTIRPITSFQAPGTRAANLSAYNNVNDYLLTITDLSSSQIVFKGKVSDFTDENNQFEEGTYEVKASYGERKPATQGNFYVEGKTEVMVTDACTESETQIPVAIECKPVCARVAVAFGEKMAQYFSDYYVTYTTKQLKDKGQTALWNKDNQDPWYLEVGLEETIKATIHVVRESDGKWLDIERTCSLSGTKGWTLNIEAATEPKNEGLIGLTISVDESVIEKPETIIVPDNWWI